MSLDAFNSTAVGKEVIGNLTDAIKATDRDVSVPEPTNPRATFNSALLLQAGLRAVLPVGEREGVALPRIFPNDPPALQDAQRNYAEVFAGGKEATPAQRQIALQSVATAAGELAAQGYKTLAGTVTNWLSGEKYAPSRPTSFTQNPVQDRLVEGLEHLTKG